VPGLDERASDRLTRSATDIQNGHSGARDRTKSVKPNSLEQAPAALSIEGTCVPFVEVDNPFRDTSIDKPSARTMKAAALL
jgi:hypothetical protein